VARSRPVLTAVLAIGAALACTGVARAQDPQASATVSLADGPTGARGAHRMTVTWSAACASAAANVRPELVIDVLAVPKRAGAEPLSVGEVQPEDAQGETALTVAAGARVFAQIRNRCTRLEFVPPGPGGDDTIEHTDDVTARSAGTILIPPWIGHARLTGCGRLHLRSGWLVHSFLRRTGEQAARRAIQIRLRGAGLHGVVHPAHVGFALGEPLDVVVAPRRTGRLRISARFAGVRSNTVALRVKRIC
jgi:hypothetical protein